MGIRLGFGASAIVFAASLLASPVLAETRTLTFHHLHTKETVSVAYKRDGRYLADGLARINHVLRDWRVNKQTEMDPRLLDVVWDVYRRSGSKQPIHVISAYRSPATNSMLRGRSANSGVAEGSLHTKGKALDMVLPDVPLSRLRALGLLAERGGVGYYPGSGSPFVHLDVGGVRHWPRMSRAELAKVFPNGDTIHRPSDGKPMPNYQLALARHQAGGNALVEVASLDSDPEANEGSPNFFERLFGRRDARKPAAETVQVAQAPAPAAPRQLPQGSVMETGFDVAARQPAQAPKVEEPVVAVLRVPLPTPAPERPVAVEDEILVAEVVPAQVEKSTISAPAAVSRGLSPELASLVALRAEERSTATKAFDTILEAQAAAIVEADAKIEASSGLSSSALALPEKYGSLKSLDELVAGQVIAIPDPDRLVLQVSDVVLADGFGHHDVPNGSGFSRDRSAFPAVRRFAPQENSKGGRVLQKAPVTASDRM